MLAGENAQGKTNVLEAVYLSCTGRSHRTRQDKELISWGADFAGVHVYATRRDGSHEVELILPAAGKRILKIAGQKASRSGALLGHVTGVLLFRRIRLSIKDGPGERRRFLDIASVPAAPRLLLRPAAVFPGLEAAQRAFTHPGRLRPGRI